MVNIKKHVKTLLVTAFLCGLFAGAAASFAMYQSAHQIHSVGVIRTIGVDVYADENLTQILDHIDWGVLDPGENKTFLAWVKNTGNDAQKILIWTEAWNPMNASDWISFTWSYDGSWIPSGDSTPVVFTLSVDANITGITNFSFEIWVKGVH